MTADRYIAPFAALTLLAGIACGQPKNGETIEEPSSNSGDLAEPAEASGASETSPDASASAPDETSPDPEAGGTAGYELPTTTSAIVRGSRLDWSFDTARPSFDAAVKDLALLCESRRTTFVETLAVVPVIEEEGLLPGDPLIERMRPVKESLANVTDIAFCAYFAATPGERKAARDTVASFIARWGDTYLGDGNPINDAPLVSLMVAADIVMPKLTAAEIAPLTKLLATMEAKEKDFMGSLAPDDGRRKNNWMLEHLSIRSYANILLANDGELAKVKAALEGAIATQFTAPKGFKLSSCSNLASVGAYGSYELQNRDSLSVHAAGLEKVVPLLRHLPGYLDAGAKETLTVALEVTKPYVEGKRSHPEYRCTKAQYDKDRLALDATFGKAWNPEDSRVLYRHARVGIASTIAWTSSLATDDQQKPWQKVYFRGKGD